MPVFIPSYTTWRPNDVPKAFDFNNQIRGTILLKSHAPAVVVHSSSDLTLAAATQTLVTWDLEEIDVDGMHTASNNPSRLTANTIGRYLVMASAVFTINSPNAHMLTIRKNAAGSPTGGTVVATGCHYGSENVLKEPAMAFVHGETILGQTDYVECFAYCTAADTLKHTTNQASRFSAVWIAIG